jgi:hypothetical protein
VETAFIGRVRGGARGDGGVEEVSEYQNDKNPEELADLLEVIYKIARLKGISKDKLENMRIIKAKERGAFESNLFLIGIDKKETL